MRYTLKTCLLLLVVVLSTATLQGTSSTAQQPTRPVSPQVLLYVAVPDDNALARFESTGLPAYALLRSVIGDRYLLAGANTPKEERLDAAGLDYQVLDGNTTGATYYLVFPHPTSREIAWEHYGRVLWEDGEHVLLRMEPYHAQRLAEQGVEIAAITLEPKPLRAPTTQVGFASLVEPDPVVQAMIDQVEQEAAHQYVGDLSGEWPVTVEGAPYTITTRYTLSGEPVQKATRYVGEHLAGLGLTVEYHSWGMAKPPNVIGQLQGSTRPDEIYLVGGHLDDMPSGSTAPGADDNATGSAGTLIAADILTQYDWKCTLRFAFWTGEEQGLLGSEAYARRASNRDEAILGVLNLDMIGWNSPGSSPDIDLHADPDLPATLDLAELFADVVATYELGLIPEIVPNGTGASDHASFWNYGYPAILGIEDYYTTGDFNPYYHTTNDLLESLDMAYFADFVRASVGTMAHMSNCLSMGQLQGLVTAAHDSNPIVDATVTMTRTVGYDTHEITDSSGAYSQTVPSGTYAMRASAYGYQPATTSNLAVGDGTVATQDFVLMAAAPMSPDVGVSIQSGNIILSWTHLPPNMSYQVHRDTSPYFLPEAATLREILNLPFSDPVLYEDSESALGTPATNHYYLVLGVNAAGDTASSTAMAEIDYQLVPGGAP